MNTVSTVWRSFRFMSAIWNSYSKSETARSPRTTQSAPSRSTRSIRSPSNEVMRIRPMPMPLVHSSMSSRRSFAVNRGSFDGLATTATMSSSKMRRLRSMRSRCPLCIGSNMPGYTARLPTLAPVALSRKSPKTLLSLRAVAKESQGRLPEPARLPARERAGRFLGRRLGPVLDHDDGAGAQDRRVGHRGEHGRGAGGIVRRIEEDYREQLRPRAEARDRAGRVVAQHAGAVRQPEPLHVVAQRAQGRGVLLHEGGRRRPAGERLDPDAACAREEIEERSRVEERHQGVQTRDAHLIRGGPRGAAPRRGEPLALQRAREHPHGTVSDWPTRSASIFHSAPSRRSAYSTRSTTGRVSLAPVASTTNTT